MNIWEAIIKEALSDQKEFSSKQKDFFDEDLMKGAEDFGFGLGDKENVENLGVSSDAGGTSSPFKLDMGTMSDVEVPSAVENMDAPSIKQDTERIDPYDEGVYE